MDKNVVPSDPCFRTTDSRPGGFVVDFQIRQFWGPTRVGVVNGFVKKQKKKTQKPFENLS